MQELTARMIEDGKKILLALDKTDNKPTSFLWKLFNGEWILIIASMSMRVESVEDRDLLAPEIGRIIREIVPDYVIQFGLTGPASRILRMLSMIIATGPDDIAGITLKDNIINGEHTGYNYVYRLNIQ